MQHPITVLDWKITAAEALDILRMKHAERFPILSAEHLDDLVEEMEQADSEEWLPVLGQELEALGLALVEQWEEDDTIRLYIVAPSSLDAIIEQIESEDAQAIVHRLDESSQDDDEPPSPAQTLERLRGEHAAQFPALTSDRLDRVMDAWAHDALQEWLSDEDVLSALGQEMEALDLALVERFEDEGDGRFHVIPQAELDDFLAQAEASGAETLVYRQEECAAGAVAYLPSPPAPALLPASASQEMHILWPLGEGWASGYSRSTPDTVLFDLRGWPQVVEVPCAFAGMIHAPARRVDGLYAWVQAVQRAPEDTRGLYEELHHEELHYVFDPLQTASTLHVLALRAPQPMSQRSIPDYALAFVGNDLLVADSNNVRLYREAGVAGQAPVCEELLALPPSDMDAVPPVIAQSEHGRTFVLCDGQVLEWYDGALRQLPFPATDAGGARRISALAAVGDAVVWIQEGVLCQGDPDTGAITYHALAGMPYHEAIQCERVHHDWLLVRHAAGQHPATDIAQLWHLASGRVARIRHGQLPLEHGLDHWMELPGGGIVVSSYRQCLYLGLFDDLLTRLAPALGGSDRMHMK